MPQDQHNIELSSFLVRSKPTLQKIALVLTILLEVSLATYIGYMTVKAVQEHATISMVGKNFSAMRSLIASRAANAQPPQIIGTTVLPRGAGGVDAIAILQNPNTDWIIHLTPTFQTSAVAVTTSTLAGLPQEIAMLPLSKYVVGSYGLPASVGEPQFQMSGVRYEHINKHIAGDLTAYRALRDQLKFTNEQYLLADAKVIDDRLAVDITNNSPFGFYDFQLQVIMYVDSAVVGVEQVSLEQFMSGQTRSLEIHSPPRGITPTRFEYVPITNIFDPQQFLKVKG